MIWRKLYAWTCQSTTSLAFSSPRTISRRSPRLRIVGMGAFSCDTTTVPVPRPTPCDDARLSFPGSCRSSVGLHALSQLLAASQQRK